MVLRHLRLLLLGPEQSHRREKELLDLMEGQEGGGPWDLGYLSFVKYGMEWTPKPSLMRRDSDSWLSQGYRYRIWEGS